MRKTAAAIAAAGSMPASSDPQDSSAIVYGPGAAQV